MHEYYARTMFDAMAGLAVFIEDEKETGLAGSSSAGAVATLGASLAAAR
jgi:hypothetical protein